MSGSSLASAAAAARVRAAAKRSPVSSGVARVPFSAPLPLPKVLLCDLDGTLIDSMPALAELATEVMEDVFAMPGALARELYLATCGLPFVQQLEEIFPGDPRNAGAVATFEGRSPPAARRSRCRPRPGVRWRS